MKRLFAVVTCFLLCAGAAQADNGWGLYGSYWKPSDGDDAFGPGFRLAVEMIPSVQLEFRAAYFDDVLEDDNPASLEVIPLDVLLALQGPLMERVDAFGGVGFTYALLDSNGDVDSGKMGFTLGGGLELVINENEAFYGGTRASLFAEVVYRALSVDVAAPGAADSEDVDLNGVGVNGGLMIRW